MRRPKREENKRNVTCSKAGYPLLSRTSCAPRSCNRSDGDGARISHEESELPFVFAQNPPPIGTRSVHRCTLQERDRIHYVEQLQSAERKRFVNIVDTQPNVNSTNANNSDLNR